VWFYLLLSLLSEAREEVKISLWLAAKQRDIPCPYVTSLSSHTSETRDLIIGKHISHIDGSKVINQFFDILPRSRDI